MKVRILRCHGKFDDLGSLEQRRTPFVDSRLSQNETNQLKEWNHQAFSSRY